MAVGVRNHSAPVYLYPTDFHTAVLCSHSLSVQAVGYRVYVWENAHWQGSKSNTEGSEFTPTCSPTSWGHPTHKLGQGLSWFRCSFLGSPVITLSDLTETQRKAFRVLVWLHRYCVNGPLSGQRDLRKAGKKWGYGMTTYVPHSVMGLLQLTFWHYEHLMFVRKKLLVV